MLQKAIYEFQKYTSRYITEENKGYQLKVDHTFRVMDLCEKIATSLHLETEKIEIAKLCGLLHDIGRFEQMKRYGTFSDKRSVDHGDLGKEVLLEDNLIRKLVPDLKLDSIFLDVVQYHNKLIDPETINEETQLFLNITRDADKIDILYLVVTEELKIDIGDFLISDDVYESILHNEMILHKNVKNKADSICMWIGFLYGLYYPYSVALLKEKNYLPQLIEQYQRKTKNEKTKEQLEEMKRHINQYQKKEEDKTC